MEEIKKNEEVKIKEILNEIDNHSINRENKEIKKSHPQRPLHLKACKRSKQESDQISKERLKRKVIFDINEHTQFKFALRKYPKFRKKIKECKTVQEKEKVWKEWIENNSSNS